jgi:hypothetical protein
MNGILARASVCLAVAVAATGCITTSTYNYQVAGSVDALGNKQAVKKSGRALEGLVKTRIGDLQFVNGYPSDATVTKLYDEMDFQRAVQAYLWGLPVRATMTS